MIKIKHCPNTAATLQTNMGQTLFYITLDFVSAIEYFEKAIHFYENLIEQNSIFEEENLNYGGCVLSNTICHLELEIIRRLSKISLSG